MLIFFFEDTVDAIFFWRRYSGGCFYFLYRFFFAFHPLTEILKKNSTKAQNNNSINNS